MSFGTQSFSFSQSGIDFENEGSDRGKVARYVIRMRSNLMNGLS